MKHVTHIIFCMLCMLCLFDATAVAQVNSSDEFFTLYFKDGTSRNFYTGDIISITHSNIDIDGTIYDEPVVQEICMITGAERYRLSDIEEMSFERLNLTFDVRANRKKWEIISAFVDNLYKGKSMSELAEYKEEINKLENVVSVIFRANSLTITIDDETSMVWLEPIEPDLEEDDGKYAKAYTSAFPDDLLIDDHKPSNGKNVLIANQLTNSTIKSFQESTLMFKNTKANLQKLGFKVDDDENVPFTYETFGKLGKYDIIVFYTHGHFDGQHWLITRTLIDDTVRSLLDQKNYFKKFSIEGRWYLGVSDSYIRDKCKLKENAIILSTACESLKENNNLADAFIENGASFFMGYDDTNTRGPKAVNRYLEHLMEDRSIAEAYNLTYLKYFYGLNSPITIGTNTILHSVTASNKEDYVEQTCFIDHPSFSTAKPKECRLYETEAKLGIKIQNAEGLKAKFNNDIKEIGIEYSYTKDDGTYVVKTIRIYDDLKDDVMLASSITPEFEKTYTYRAYLKTSDNVYYGDDEQFVANDKEARAELKRIYDIFDGKNWGTYAKNWNDPNVPITRWANVTTSWDNDGYKVNLYSVPCTNVTNVYLDGFKRISRLTLPKSIGTLDNLTISDCPIMSNVENYNARDILFTACPKLKNIETGDDTRDIAISDCHSIKSILGKSFGGQDKLHSVTAVNCNALEMISVSNEKNLSNLTIKGCDKLTSVYCSSCNLSGSLDLMGCPNLRMLNCSNNQITKLLMKSGDLLDFTYYNNPIRQTYESIPNFDRSYNDRYIYTSCMKEDLQDMLELGYSKVGEGISPYNGRPMCLLYKEVSKDEPGFWHIGEPNDKRYWGWDGIQDIIVCEY